jgi:two-component system response regulator HydG
MKRILVIDDDTYMCNLLVNYLKQKRYITKGAYNGKTGKKLIKRNNYDVILCDFRLPDTNGTEILEFIKSESPSIPVIIITAYSDIKMAVSLIKAGAFDYVTKPLQPEEILQLVTRAIEANNKNDSNTSNNSSFSESFITGRSKRIKEVMRHVKAVASTEVSVLIEGETGSGKEFIARAIHHESKRSGKPFIPVDCGAIPKDLANSELFGHVRGAFTGAVNDKTGYYEQANGGTLFLDEVGNLHHENQLKLLRALESRMIQRVGDNRPVEVDVRILSASNVSLTEKIKSGEFRDDLYHRLNGFKIKLPALRQRREDIMEFTNFFIKKANRELNKKIKGIDNDSKDLFYHYKWYGNIRELQNIVFRAVLLSQTDLITPDILPDEIRYCMLQTGELGLNDGSTIHVSYTDLKEATVLTEKEVINNALIKSNYNKSKAAKILNIDRKTLYNKIRLYNIEILK